MDIEKQFNEEEKLLNLTHRILEICQKNLVNCGTVLRNQGFMVTLNEIDNEECHKLAKSIFDENDFTLDYARDQLFAIKDLIDKEIGKKKKKKGGKSE